LYYSIKDVAKQLILAEQRRSDKSCLNVSIDTTSAVAIAF